MGFRRSDGDSHPNVEMLALDEGGDHIAWCSGFYAGAARAFLGWFLQLP